jgi:hypothetical protein
MGNYPKTHIVIEVVGDVPVAVSTASVPTIVVPRPAAQLAARPYNHGKKPKLLASSS